jgi:hypothetical protein
MIWAAIPALMKMAGGLMGGAAASGGAAAGSGGGGLMSMAGGAGTAGARPGGGMTPYSNPFESIGDFDSGNQFEGFSPTQQVADTPSGSAAPTMPKPPFDMENLGDVSGFANYGMTPPTLPNAREGYGGLMGLSQLMDPNRNRKEDPFQQQQPGGLMAYLQALSRS